jgi:hypothetical protein
MRFKKTYLLLSLFLLLAVVIGIFLWMWVHAAPESVRLLPESDAVAYLNLTPLRLANVFASLQKPSHAPEYETFIQQTGFDFERDLDEVGIAVHLPSAQPASSQPAGNASGAAQETRFSEVFQGSFDGERVSTFFRRIARTTEIYGGKEIFTIPVEDRLVRVAIVSANKVAVSNVESPQVIHQMIDRSSQVRLPFLAPALVREHYKDVPFGSLAWAIGKYSSSGNSANLSLPGGFDIPLPAQTTWVASLRYAGSIELKAQALSASEEDARKVADTLGTLLGLFRSLQTNIGTQGPDADVKNFFDSLQVTQEGSRTIFTANIPIGFVKKLAREAPGAITEKPVEPEPALPQRKK